MTIYPTKVHQTLMLDRMFETGYDMRTASGHSGLESQDTYVSCVPFRNLDLVH